MGQANTLPRRINGVEGVAGQVMVSGGPGVVESWADRAALTVGKVEVFSGNSPVGWTDLDLSGTVGANPALVVLEIWNSGGGINLWATAVRANGDTDEYWSNAFEDYAYGTALGHLQGGVAALFVVATDALGVIEWSTEFARGATTVDIVAYIN